jgi:thiol-disulfide isomerase/thioredoxin
LGDGNFVGFGDVGARGRQIIWANDFQKFHLKRSGCVLKKILSGVIVVLLILTCCTAEAGVFPAFSSQTLNGEAITNSIFTGKKLTMINIWATWCGPCISEMRDLGELGRSMPEGTQLVGILEDNALDTARKIVAERNADFPHILASSEMNSYLYTVNAIPWTIFVNSKGEIIGEPLVGSRNAAAYRSAIENILEQEGGNSVVLQVEGAGGNLVVDKPIAEAGETITVVYTADGGYELNEIWVYKGGDESIIVPFSCTGNICTFTMPDYPVTVVASFKKTGDVPNHPITLPDNTDVTGGSVTMTGETAKVGDVVTVTYTPDSGYVFEAIWIYKTGDESTTVPLSCSGNICTFVMPDYPVSVVVSFKKIEGVGSGYPITLPVGITGGKLTADKNTAIPGDTVTVIYTPDSGYELETIEGYKTGDKSITVPLSCSGNICTFTMPAHPVTVSVSFKKTGGSTSYPIILPASSTGGRVTTDKAVAAAGESVTLTFIPNSGYKFDTAWAYNPNNPSQTVPLSCSGNVCSFTMPAYPVTITASFTRVSNSNPIPSNPVSPNKSGGGGCNVNIVGPSILALAGLALLKKNYKR